ncbi:filamentous hemagglutinin N-terminal domain-containing protein [Arcobacter sp. KX21116]|uniref:two-partner secretion domain-containing protein n=1 Tax=Arcobacter iocasae TaxID=2906515 RepID=UPI0035D48EE0
MKRLIDFSSRFRILKGGKISMVVSALLAGVTISYAAPSGGVVTSGTANISQNGNTTNITQSTQKATINWNKFNIAQNETVNFKQPNSSSITLNRVIGNERSVINGALNANGQVWILNSNGVLFGKNASINTAGLLATTAKLSDNDFNIGNYNFKNSSSNSVINLGTINISNEAYAVLAGKEVTNEGSIKAVKGKIHLVGADEYSINLNGNSLLNLTVKKGILDSIVKNSGSIKADGGEIYLTTNAVNELLKGVVNNTGVIEANSMGELTGKVELFAHGGEAQVGGTISATDGFVETSGKDFTFNGANIVTSNWLIDPVNITIDSSLASAIQSALDTADVTITTDGSNTPDTSATGTNSESAGDGDININSNITTNALNSDKTLTLLADNNIVFADGISIDAGQNSNTNKLNVILTADKDNNGNGQVILSGATGNTIITNNGDLTINNQVDSNVDGETPLTINAGTGKITLNDDLGENKKLKSLNITASSVDLGTKLHFINTLNEQVYNATINSLSTDQFVNSGFENGDTTGWTVDTTNTIYLNGGSVIAGTATPTDDVLPNTVPSQASTNNSGAYDDYTSSGTYTDKISTDTDSEGGQYSLQLTYSGGNVSAGYGVVHGPSVVSDSSVSLGKGDEVSFKWKASGGSDAYDVFGYILNVDTGETQTILNQTGATGNAATNWATASVTANKAGNYKFIFIAGSWDASGGQALGANLYIDGISTNSKKTFSGSAVTFNNPLNAHTNSLEIIADKVALNANISGSDTLTIKQKTNGNNIEIGGTTTADNSILDITSSNLANIQSGFSKVTFGDDTTAKVTTKGPIVADYNLTLIGKTAGVEISNELNIGTKTLTIESNSDVNDSGQGHIIAKNLNIKGTGDFTLDSNNNDVDVLAAGTSSSPIGKLVYRDADDLTIGKVNDSKGLNSTDNIKVSTVKDTIKVLENVTTSKQGSDVINFNGEENVSKGRSYDAPEKDTTPETVKDNRPDEIKKVITTIANNTTTNVVLPKMINTPKVKVSQNQMPQTNGNVSIVSKTINGENANKVITLSEIKTAMKDDNTKNTTPSNKQKDVRVPLSSDSVIDLVNGGVKLPEGVDQLFYVVENEGK